MRAGVPQSRSGTWDGPSLWQGWASTKDYYGLKNFGVNYGLVFTAWGIGGFVLSLVAGAIFDSFGAFTYAYYVASALPVLAAAVSFVLKPPAAHRAAE